MSNIEILKAIICIFGWIGFVIILAETVNYIENREERKVK